MEAVLSAQMAVTRQNAMMGIVKSNNDAQKAMAEMLTQTIENAPTGSGRGSIVNITV